MLPSTSMPSSKGGAGAAIIAPALAASAPPATYPALRSPARARMPLPFPWWPVTGSASSGRCHCNSLATQASVYQAPATNKPAAHTRGDAVGCAGAARRRGRGAGGRGPLQALRDGSPAKHAACQEDHPVFLARSTVLISFIFQHRACPAILACPWQPPPTQQAVLTNLATPCETSQTCGCVRALWSYDASACQTNVNPTLATCVPLACSVHTCRRPHGGWGGAMGREAGRRILGPHGGSAVANRRADRGAWRESNQRQPQL